MLSPEMTASPVAFDLIRKWESQKLECYLCPAGKPTIGYGHTGPDVTMQSKPITVDQAEALLKLDVMKFSREVSNMLLRRPRQAQFDALVSFAFNLGSDALKKSTLLRLINSDQCRPAADEFPKWIHAKDQTGKLVPLEGLRRRRAEERALFIS